MEDDESKARGAAIGNRTIQIDALTDVQLIDHREEPVGRAPPPLPRKEPTSPVGKIVGLVLGIAFGVLVALAIVHFVFPASAPVAATPAAPVAPAADVRHVQMDEELVIRADEQPAAEVPTPEEPAPQE